MLHTYVLVAKLLRLVLRADQHLVEVAADIDSGFGASYLVDAGQGALRPVLELAGVDPHLLDELQNKAVLYS